MNDVTEHIINSHAEPATTFASLVDVIALAKPRIVILVLITAAGGMLLAPHGTSAQTAVILLLGTALLVASANALNMYLERDIDIYMVRTRKRPLPDGRMAPSLALWLGIATAFLAVALLTFAVNPLTGALCVTAHLSYVFFYTPLKQRTSNAVWVGAVPGAMPPLLGWTAVTDSLDFGGLALFGLMFLWQIPHFHAIAMFRVDEYRRAGLKTLPGERGDAVTRRAIVRCLFAQVAVSLVLTPLGVAGGTYLVAAAVLGSAYAGYAVVGAQRADRTTWARRMFFASLVYLPLLFAALVVDARV